MPNTSRGAPYPAANSGNNAPADIQALATWVDARPGLATLTTTQRNALSGVELWEGREIYNTTSKRYEFFNGTAWVAANGAATQKFLNTSGTVELGGLGSSGLVFSALALSITSPGTSAIWAVELDAVFELAPGTGDTVTGFGYINVDGVDAGSSVVPNINIRSGVYARTTQHRKGFISGLSVGNHVVNARFDGQGGDSASQLTIFDPTLTVERKA